MPLLSSLLFVLGVGFFVASVRVGYQFVRFLRLRSSAILTWPGRRPPFYGLALGLGAVLGLLIIYKLVFLRMAPVQVFGEFMMLIYYVYAMPLSGRIARGFYEDGIWSDGGFIPYSRIGGLTWREREGEPLTLVLIYRMRAFARRLSVPQAHYGAARRLLRDKIAAHRIHFSGTTLDLERHDERDDV
ncbi:MAG TPA: hypothetical protein VFX12_12370 [Vicinamibacterales bacterium]|nr:hypothetical protein [Vicinamibacterales bacterium]